MPTLRDLGATSTPACGSDTTDPPMRMRPDVGCSSPATQRKVVVLPQPEGPSSATISPAAIVKLTSSTAGLPVGNPLRRFSTRSSVDMLLPVAEHLVPLLQPRIVQLFGLLVVRHPDLFDFGVEALGQRRWHFQRGQVALFLDREGLAVLR